MRAVSAALLFALLVACDLPFAPAPPYAARRIQPRPEYEIWWAMTEQCAGRTGRFRDVAWFVVPGKQSFSVGRGRYADGEYIPFGNSIVLAEPSLYDARLVRHEMLHALLGTSEHSHPREYFIKKCDGVVVCHLSCLDDAGPPPAPDSTAFVTTPLELEVSADVTPASPNSSQHGGYFGLAVTVRNPTPFPLEVHLPPRGDGAPMSFSYIISLPSANRAIRFDQSTEFPEDTHFAAFETKTYVFDFWVGGKFVQLPFVPGAYYVTGAYGGVLSPTQHVTIGP